MPSTLTAILQDIVSTLVDSGLFAEVSLGNSEGSTAVPRAHVTYEGHEVFFSDDNAGNLWVRLRARVLIRTRSDNLATRLARTADLGTSAGDALMADPYRGQRCRDLPIGGATELGRSELTHGIRRPQVEMALAVRCHFEQEES
ncbi:MAG: hypothetical protein ACYTF6_00045 [Planctomycetota bacterium]|jgi:hypothetical protein